MTRAGLPVTDPRSTSVEVVLACWCRERTGRPLPHCRDCGGTGMMPTRLPAPPVTPQVHTYLRRDGPAERGPRLERVVARLRVPPEER